MSSQDQPEDSKPDDDQPEADEPETDTPEDTGAENSTDTGADAPSDGPDASAGGADEDGDADGDADEDDKPPTEDERLEQITDRIEKARTQAEDAGVLEDLEENEFVDSGATEEEDDQTIAPPG